MRRLRHNRAMLTGSLLAAVAALWPGPSAAVTEADFKAKTVGDLAGLCAAKPADGKMGSAAANFCQGYAQGAVSVQLSHEGIDKLFCFPEPPPPRSATLDEFVTWARADPSRLSKPAAEGLFEFMARRFPCAAKK